MKLKYIYIISCVIFASCVSACYSQTEYKLNNIGKTLPGNLIEAIDILDNELSSNLKQDIKNTSRRNLSKYHFDLGLSIRNEWKLWHNSALALWFKENGVYHPDDMSNLIIDIYWKHLNNMPLTLKESVTKIRKEYDDLGINFDSSKDNIGEDSVIIPMIDPEKVKTDTIELE